MAKNSSKQKDKSAAEATPEGTSVADKSIASRFSTPQKRLVALWTSAILLGLWMAALVTLAIVLRL